MRETKFRGMRKDKGGFVYGDLDQNDIHHGVSIRQNGCIINAVIPETVGQYTGLKDKNDKEIYEGDIIIDKDGNICVVVWMEEWGMFGSMFTDELEKYKSGGIDTLDESTLWTFPVDFNNIEVIGNIHENPELLNPNINPA